MSTMGMVLLIGMTLFAVWGWWVAIYYKTEWWDVKMKYDMTMRWIDGLKLKRAERPLQGADGGER